MTQESAQNGQGAGNKPSTTNIIVNARPRHVEGSEITYVMVVQLAFGESNPEIIYTVSYTAPKLPDGTLVEGQSVAIENGMKFDVKRTNRS